MKPREYIHFYKEHFNTLEINNSFYRLPSEAVFHEWKTQVSDSFLFSVKASRYITHVKRLKPPLKESTDLLISKSAALGHKLGPILFQLPPSLGRDMHRLTAFVEDLPSDLRFTFEFRNHSWYTDEVYALLHRYNLAFCWYELDHHTSPEAVTADFVYVRLHGPEAKYQGSYSDDKLQRYAEKFSQLSLRGIDVYCYFDNDQHGYAAHNAFNLRQLIK